MLEPGPGRNPWRIAMAVTAIAAVAVAVVAFATTDRHDPTAPGVNATALPVRFEYTIASPPTHAVGQYDGRHHQGWMRVAPNSAVMVFDMNHVWVPTPAAHVPVRTSWVRYDVGAQPPEGTTPTVQSALRVAANLRTEDPFTYFDRLRASADLRREDREVVRGEAATRYGINLTTLPDLAFVVWVDDRGHVRRINQRFGGEEVSNVDFFAFGAPLEHAQVPPGLATPALDAKPSETDATAPGVPAEGTASLRLHAPAVTGQPVMNALVSMVRARLVAYGARANTVRRDADDVVVTWARANVPDAAVKALVAPGHIEFRPVRGRVTGECHPSAAVARDSDGTCYDLAPAELLDPHATDAHVNIDSAHRLTAGITLDRSAASAFDAVADRHFGEQVAIVVDGIVVDAPIVNARSYNGRLQLAGRDDLVRLVAAVFATGPLPVRVSAGTLERRPVR